MKGCVIGYSVLLPVLMSCLGLVGWFLLQGSCLFNSGGFWGVASTARDGVLFRACLC